MLYYSVPMCTIHIQMKKILFCTSVFFFDSRILVNINDQEFYNLFKIKIDLDFFRFNI